MDKLKVIIEGSGRHVHVTKEHLKCLFGEGAQLHNKRELSQPRQYLTEEKVRIEGPRGSIDRVSILGPERSQTQIEVTFTDARTLGLVPPVNESGDLKGSSPIRIIGPEGSIDLEEGCIVAKRHIHITPQDAELYGLKDREIVQVRVEGDRALTFDEVVVRVSENYRTRMHIDFDEMNAAQICTDQVGLVIKK